ncbi:MAG TPA: DUF397 domain-containing protein [Pseudonocardiaceae bacterium]|nr:DUF397 domain-containing protein [Pseudonocardiaceae bacterium]
MTHDPTPAVWRKSTFSNTQGACVEVATLRSGVGVRDSKNPAGPSLRFPADEWTTFTAGVRAGEFD